jgi:hypothetical protein
MSSESVCHVVRSWVNVGSFHTRLFGVVYVTCGDFQDGPEEETAIVHQILCQSWETCYGDPHNDSISLRGPNLEFYAGVSIAFPVQDRSHVIDDDEHTGRPTSCTQGDPQAAQLLKLLHVFNSSSVGIDVGPFMTLLRRWKLVMGHANGF